MRVIFETPSIPNVTVKRPDGTPASGSVHFFVRLFEPNEVVPPSHHAVTVREWKKGDARADGTIRATPPFEVIGPPGVTVPAAVIPAELLATLPDDAQLEFTWHLQYGGVR